MTQPNPTYPPNLPGLPANSSYNDPASMQSRIVNNIIADAYRLAARADSILAPISADRLRLRQLLLDDPTGPQIIDIGPHTDINVTVAAVDGGSVTERMYAADLLVAAAVSAEGMGEPSGLPLGQSTWTHIERHEGDLDRLTGAAMVAQELRVLADLQHDLRIFDGSHGTPVIGLSSALFSRNPTVRNKIIELCDEWDIPGALRSITTSQTGEIIALPKADSSKIFTNTYAEKYGVTIAAGDRFLAAQLLHPGEMLHPRPASEYTRLTFSSVSMDDDAARMAEALNYALQPLIDHARNKNLQVTYVKPEGSETVVKIEFQDGDGLHTARRIGRIISDETPGPHLQEPFAQYLADLNAKSVSIGANAVKAAMIANLPETATDYLPYLARSYRT